MNAPLKSGHRVASAASILAGLALAASGLSPKPSAAQGTPAATDGWVHVYVVLEGESVARAVVRQTSPDPGGRLLAAAARLQRITAEQDAVSARLQALGARETGRFTGLVNAIRARVPAARAEELTRLPGVARVRRVGYFVPLTSTSVPFIGGVYSWTNRQIHADGSGVKIGIIDTGIDYTHADFGGPNDPWATEYWSNDPARITDGGFPTAKVPGGYDFAGDDYYGGNTPVPDPDPLDCWTAGHGTHVAGIAAGVGVYSNGNAYSGSYTGTFSMASFFIGPGVAPKASLYAIKIFGCYGGTELVLDGLEWAADPDSDGAFDDRMDVVNLSLGSPYGIASTNDVELEAIQTLSDLGCVVCCAAGNNGNQWYALGSPACAPAAITVANSIDNGSVTRGLLRITAPPVPGVTGVYEAVEGLCTVPLWDSGVITGRVVAPSPRDACSIIINYGFVSNKIALVDRGKCDFVDKIERVQKAGALAVIVVNNTDGPPVPMDGTSTNIHIPGVMISKADGAKIKQYIGGTVTARLDYNLGMFPHPEWADRIDESTSRGPSSPFNSLKPDIAAPGYNILSAEVASGTGGWELEGTSMSCPHIAGAAALLKELHPAWSPADIKAALMNSAAPTRDAAKTLYPETMTGAGRVRANFSALATVRAYCAEDRSGVGISFGSLAPSDTISVQRHIVVTNFGSAATLKATVSNSVTEAGVSITVTPLTNTIPAMGCATVTVTLTANPRLFDRTMDTTTPDTQNGSPRQALYETSGEIYLQGVGQAQSIHVPYLAALRAASAFQPSYECAGISATGTTAAASVPIQGASGHTQPLVSAFQLGALSPRLTLTNEADHAADLVAVGAASDATNAATFASGRIYFGIAVAGPWTTPIDYMTAPDVEIDADSNGLAEFTILNSSQGNWDANDTYPDYANDVFMSLVQEGENVSSGGYLNVFSRTERDTSPFNSSVMVKPVPVSSLGLTAPHPTFNYRVRSRAPGTLDGSYLDETPWIPFNALKPVVQAVGGINRTPFFPTGQTVRVALNLASVPASAGSRWAAGHNGNAVRLDGTNDFVEVADDALLDIASADGLTLCAWTKWMNPPISDNAAILSKGDGIRMNYLLGTLAKTRQVFFTLRSAAAWNDISSGLMVKSNDWSFVAVTVSGNSLTFYVDGITAGRTKTDALAATAAPLRIGWSGNLAGQKFNGLLDDVRIYRRALSVPELGEVYSNRASDAGMAACWPCDAAQGFVVSDASTNHLDGLLSYATNQPALLLLEHMNGPSNQARVVRFDTTTPDLDGDGMPDQWEVSAFGSPTNAGAATDADMDSFPDASEYAAGTDPLDAKSLLELRDVAVSPATGVLIRWLSVAGRSYAIERATNLVGLSPFLPLTNAVPATAPTNTFLDSTAAGQGPYLYRIKVQ